MISAGYFRDFYAAVVEVRGVLFDFGHTLFAHAPLAATIARCARQLGAEMNEGDAASLARRIDAASMEPRELAHARDLDSTVWKQRWAILYGIADECIEGLGEAIDANMHDPMAWIPYSGSSATLSALHAHGIAVGVVSNTGWDVRSVFAAHSMDGVVTSFTLSYEAGAVKPDRRIFDLAGESMRLSADQLVMVGDDPRADAGAVTAGIRTMLLPARPPHTDNGIAAVLDLVGIRD
jgi:FMN phosphatase YigB (HAD superfamily)